MHARGEVHETPTRVPPGARGPRWTVQPAASAAGALASAKASATSAVAARAAVTRCIEPGRGPDALLAGVDRPLELGLVHARPALDAEVARLVVELVARAALLPVGARPLSAPPPRGHVLRRRARRAARLAAASTLLVDSA